MDARADLSSLGWVLVELLGGGPRFGSGVDGPVVAVAKDPARRSQRAVELPDALAQVLAGKAVAAGAAVRGAGRRPGWPGDRAAGGIAVARRCQHPGSPARGRPHRRAGDRRSRRDHPGIRHARAIGARGGGGLAN